MKAFITSINEPTTELCRWQLERYGFQTVLIQDARSLGEKLEDIYNQADADFIRVDADVIVNSNIKIVHSLPRNFRWVQFKTFDMYKLDLTNGGVQWISKEIIFTLRANISQFKHDNRPESRMFRLDEFNQRQNFITAGTVAGIHGFGQKDWQRVKDTKDQRKDQAYDWEIVKRMQDYYR